MDRTALLGRARAFGTRLVRGVDVRTRQRRYARVLADLPAFVPNSAGKPKELAELTLTSAVSTFPLLADLARPMKGSPRRWDSASEFAANYNGADVADRLFSLFREHGSDKSTTHDYHVVLGAVISDMGGLRRSLEVGIGSQDQTLVSHMRPGTSSPGGSLRALREAFPSAEIFGADVDPQVLFQEDGIRTYEVDQLRAASLDALDDLLPGNIDLVIDDGLHSPDANLGVTRLALSQLRSGGWLIIEDISSASVPIWEVAGAVLSPLLDSHIVRTRSAYVFAGRRKP